MPIAIMAAMPEEIDALKPLMQSPHKTTRAGREFIQGTLFGHEVVIVFSRWGKVASASTATELVLAYQVRSIVLIGIAGSISYLKAGDMVVAAELLQHDLDARPFFPATHIPMLSISRVPTDARMRGLFMGACEAASATVREWLDPELCAAAGITRPRVAQGTMATGDQVISSKCQRDAVLAHAPDALSVDMESAAVAQVAYEHRIPFGCVRIISDGADEHITRTVAPFLGGLASAYTVAIVRRWLSTTP